MSGLDVAINGVAVSTYTFPTDQPEADGTLAWSATTMVIVEVSGGGQTGLGYTYATPACQPLIEQVLADAIQDRPGNHIPDGGGTSRLDPAAD